MNAAEPAEGLLAQPQLVQAHGRVFDMDGLAMAWRMFSWTDAHVPNLPCALRLPGLHTQGPS